MAELRLSACVVQATTSWGGPGSSIDGLTYTLDQPRAIPRVLNVSMTRGSTAGGTHVVVEGIGFTSDQLVTVKFSGVPCEVLWVHGPNDAKDPTTLVSYPYGANYTTDRTLVACRTGYHGPTSYGARGVGLAELTVAGLGLGAASVDAQYQYVDLWSRYSTWGGNPPPIRGDTVWIQPGQTLMLDYSPPYLYFLLIDGGTVIFDRTDINLNASYIFVAHGGKLTVGTELEPFEQQAVIPLHGNSVSQELPTYGAKLIGCRECVLDFHGIPRLRTSSLLDFSVAPGDARLCLQHMVDWEVGSAIIITSTSHWKGFTNPTETEEHVIAKVTNNGYCLVLESPVRYFHRGETHTSAGYESPDSKDFRDRRMVQLRAEVALLTHNIRCALAYPPPPARRGEIESDCGGVLQWLLAQLPWLTVACAPTQLPWLTVALPLSYPLPPAGGAASSFSSLRVQGDDDSVYPAEYGVQIHVHSWGHESSIVRIENIEMWRAGQQGRKNRFPMFFNRIGYLRKSYVRQCAIHRSYNRGIVLNNVRRNCGAEFSLPQFLPRPT